MKRVTLVVSPAATRADSSEPAGSASTGPEEVSRFRVEDGTDDGSIRLEAVLNAERAREIVDAMLGIGDMEAAAVEQTLETLVQREVDSPDSHGILFERMMSTVERILIGRVYEACQGVQTRAADHLGIDRNTLHKKLCKYKLLLATPNSEAG